MKGASEGPSARNLVLWTFAGLGLLAVLAFVLFAADLLGRDPYQPAKVRDDGGKLVFTVGNAQDLPGTDLVSMMVAASEAAGSYSSYSADDRRNVLLIDKASGASRRILPDNSRRINDVSFLAAQSALISQGGELLGPGAADGGEEDPVSYYLLTIFRTGGEEERLQDVLVGSLSDGRQQFVMKGIDGIDTLWMQSSTRIGMLVREDLSLFFRVVDIPTLKVITSRRIEIG